MCVWQMSEEHKVTRLNQASNPGFCMTVSTSLHVCPFRLKVTQVHFSFKRALNPWLTETTSTTVPGFIRHWTILAVAYTLIFSIFALWQFSPAPTTLCSCVHMLNPPSKETSGLTFCSSSVEYYISNRPAIPVYANGRWVRRKIVGILKNWP